MSFYEKYQSYADFNFSDFFASLSDQDIIRIINKNRLTELDYLALLSPAAETHLEAMAQRAHRLTVQHFGKVIFLFTPLYLANHCTNRCVYCGFATHNEIPRRQMTLAEVEEEAKYLAATGMKQLIILTGESRHHSPVSYMIDCVEILKNYFPSTTIEVYPLTEEEYASLVAAGVDGMTMFQEVYNPEVYAEMHPAGPKHNYHFRLDAPERACRAGMRTIGLGALLGLHDWRSEAFFTGLHANYLQSKYPEVEVSISPPRMRPHVGGFPPRVTVSDKNLVQYILAFRLFMPRGGITLSTREPAEFRNQLIQLGVTKMSAGSCTAVGGHTHAENNTNQFEISDDRDVPTVLQMIREQGYQPVFKDWQLL